MVVLHKWIEYKSTEYMHNQKVPTNMGDFHTAVAWDVLRNFSLLQLQCHNQHIISEILETQTSDPIEKNEADEEYNNLVKVCHVLLVMIGISGIIGNTLSVIVLMSSKELRHSGITTYLIALEMADNFVLVTAIFRYKAYYLFLNELQFIRSKFTFDAYVEVYVEPIHYIFLGASSFLTVGLTTERYLAIRFPIKIKQCCTGTVNLVCVTITFLVVFALTVPIFFDYRVVTINFLGLDIKQVEMTEYGRNNWYRCFYHTLLIPIGWYILPWIHLFICNCLLIHNVKKSSARVHSQLSNNNRAHQNSNSRSLTIVLIGVVLTYMVCHLPNCVITLITLVQYGGKQACSPGGDAISSPLQAAQLFTEVLNIINSGINFLLYCCFGKNFRKQFLKL